MFGSDTKIEPVLCAEAGSIVNRGDTRGEFLFTKLCDAQ
jgi:hypothetical protein